MPASPLSARHLDDKRLEAKKRCFTAWCVFFLPGGLLHKQGPRRARLRAAPLPHSHNALLATSCCCAPAGGPRRGPGAPPQHRAPASVHLEGGSVAAGARSVRPRRRCELFGVGAGQQRYIRFVFLPGGLLHKQGPRRALLRAAPLPHSHNALVVTSCFLQEGQVREQEVPHNTLPLGALPDSRVPST
jgi:hypothetical protein